MLLNIFVTPYGGPTIPLLLFHMLDLQHFLSMQIETSLPLPHPQVGGVSIDNLGFQKTNIGHIF